MMHIGVVNCDFFFQAEDCIRDLTVTGVQTCALPIFTTHHSLKHAPKIFTETCKIDFTKTTEEVHNLIRGLSPFPGAFTELKIGRGRVGKECRSRWSSYH